MSDETTANSEAIGIGAFLMPDSTFGGYTSTTNFHTDLLH
jgi:hypothetical protein